MFERGVGRRIVQPRNASKIPTLPPSGGHVLLVDPCAMSRECLTNLLIGHRLHVDAVGDAPDAIFANLLLLHIGPARIDEPCVQKRIATLRGRCYGNSAVAVISDIPDLALALAAVRLGLRGYLPTSLSAKMAAAAVELILTGGIFVPAAPDLGVAAAAPSTSSLHRRREFITDRENEVLAALKEGQPNKIIAHGLRISEHTVKVHIRNIMKKLHATNRTQLALMAGRMALANEGSANS